VASTRARHPSIASLGLHGVPRRICAGRPFLLFAIALALLAGASPPRSASAASLGFEPAFAFLGAFNTLDPLDSDTPPGRTSIMIQSDQDWRLEVRLKEPLRRTADGLQLPVTRAPAGRGSAAARILSLTPHVVLSGSGSGRNDPSVYDWHGLTMALEQYLERGDPPGTYEGTLLARLLDTAGSPITDEVAVTFQFEISRWVEIVGRDLPDIQVPVTDGALDGESAPAAVTLTSNTSWTLLVATRRGPGRGRRGREFDVGTLAACVPGNGSGGRWRAIEPGCLVLGTDPAAFIAGDAPPPFTLSTEEIPVVIRFHADRMVPAGTYGAALRFTARVGDPGP
jgi:hypothetical protein